jgi:hypothetical protein
LPIRRPGDDLIHGAIRILPNWKKLGRGPFCKNLPHVDVSRPLSPASVEPVVLELKFEMGFCLPLVQRIDEGGDIHFAMGVFLGVPVPLWGTDSHLLRVCGACAHDDTAEEGVFRDLGNIRPRNIVVF